MVCVREPAQERREGFRAGVRNRDPLHALSFGVEHVEAAYRSGLEFSGPQVLRPHEDVDRVLAIAIDEHGDAMAVEILDSCAQERKVFGREVDNRRQSG